MQSNITFFTVRMFLDGFYNQVLHNVVDFLVHLENDSYRLIACYNQLMHLFSSTVERSVVKHLHVNRVEWLIKQIPGDFCHYSHNLYTFHAPAISIPRQFVKCGHHHFFLLIFIRCVAAALSNKSTPPIASLHIYIFWPLNLDFLVLFSRKSFNLFLVIRAQAIR